MSAEAQEQMLLAAVAADLQAEGFQVYLNPSKELLPSSLRNVFMPDGIAVSADKKIVIEVSQEGPKAQLRIKKLQAAMENEKEWELRVYWAKPTGSPKPVERVPREAIERTIADTGRLVEEGYIPAALLMAWSSFEALGRSLMPESFLRPQTPGRLVEVLASAGHITPTEADLLRRLATARNSTIHGALQAEIRSDDVSSFVAIQKGLLDSLPVA